MNEMITLDRLQAGAQVLISDSFARSLEVESTRDAMLRATVMNIAGWFTSNKIYEETREIERTLSWHERIRALLGKPIVYKVHIEMRRNCPHIAAEPMRDHVSFLVGR